MFTLAMIIAFLLACACILAIVCAAYALACRLAKEECWRALLFMGFVALFCFIAFVVLDWLVANDPVLRIIRMEI